ncbi:MAG TPA: hypothetical protein VFI24_19185 [Pyrinomonadaceae bacterium]|nr:hypothetical protein [Pyrinomonadaceae bacterium]
MKAVLIALVSSFLFIGFLTVAFRSAKRDNRVSHRRFTAESIPPRPVNVPVNVPVVETPLPPIPPDGNEPYRFVPASFSGIDFSNRSYGTYTFPDGKHIDLELVSGQFRLFLEQRHFFNIRDVFYADVTGDSIPEAIVRLSHLRCINTCDGAADLFYIYALEKGVLQELFHYETGNTDSGCGLKSFKTRKKQVSLEMFGECPRFADIPKASKSVVVDRVTRLEFSYEGDRFTLNRKRIFPITTESDVSYATEVRIADDLPRYRVIPNAN